MQGTVKLYMSPNSFDQYLRGDATTGRFQPERDCPVEVHVPVGLVRQSDPEGAMLHEQFGLPDPAIALQGFGQPTDRPLRGNGNRYAAEPDDRPANVADAFGADSVGEVYED